MKTLILNSDGRPLSVVSARRAVMLELSNPNVTALSYYDKEIKTINGSIKIPAVMTYAKFVYVKNKTHATKRSIRARDNNRCGYCGCVLSNETFTVDHVIPVSRFANRLAANTWENQVACCKRCNNRKGNMTPEEASMPLLVTPRKASIGMLYDKIPDEWDIYIN